MALIKSVRGFTPKIGNDTFLADNATIIGDVEIGDGCSIWFGTVLRGNLHFTRVLKGHISLAKCKFPQGTRGSQLDILARKALWDNGINYMHGTGHGIGHFLNVHEGPQSIRMEENPVALQPGMVISNEPGVYRTDEYGIRIENLILVREDSETEFGKFYSFETLTLFPIDRNLVITSMLSAREHAWLNRYHQL